MSVQNIVKSIDKIYSNFSPLNITGCVLWLDPSDAGYVSQTNNTITKLVDKSVMQNDATAVGVVSWGGSNTINSLPALRFAGTYMTLSGSKLPWQNGASFSVFASTIPQGALNASQAVISWGDFPPSATAAFTLYHFNWRYVGTFFGGRETYALGGLNVSNTRNIQTIVVRNNTSPTIRGWSCGFYNSYSSISFVAYNVNTGSTTAVIASNNNGNSLYTGLIGEILVYNRDVSPLEQMQIEGYLAQKWGIPTGTQTNIPSNRSMSNAHAYALQPPYTRPFFPIDAPSLTAWFDAADAMSYSVSGNNVFWWQDKSGNGINAFQSTTAQGPLAYRTAGSNTFYFQNTLSHTMQALLTLSSTANHHLVAVHRPSVTTGGTFGNTSLFRWQGGGPTGYIVFPYMNGFTPRGYITSWDGAPIAFDASNLLDNSSSATFQIMEAAIASGSQTIYRNGTVTSSNTQALTAGVYSATFYIGSFFGAGEYYAGQLQEYMVYNSILDNVYRQPLESYLAYKWNLQASLPSNTTNFFFSKFPGYTTIWNPFCIPSLTIWLDPSDRRTLNPATADKSLTFAGNSITSILNKANGGVRTLSNGFVPARVGSTEPPIVIRQYSSNTNLQYLELSTNPLWSIGSTTFVNSMTVFAYFSKTTPQRFPVYYGTDSSGNVNRSNTEFYLGDSVVANVSSGTTFTSLTSLGTAAGWYVYSNGYSNSTSLSNAYRINFTPYSATGGVAVAFKSFSGRSIIGATASTCFSHSLAELLVYRGNLSPFELFQVEGYLAHKWGLLPLLPASHPFKEIPPGVINTAQFTV